MQKSAKYAWDAIVVTCTSKSCCDAYVDELNRRKRANLIDAKTLILGASDPGARVGSGGATLNAILVVCEHMSSLAGYTIRQSPVMLDKRVLVLHVAWGDCFIDPCGKALMTTPRSAGSLIVPSALDTVLETMHQLFKGAPYGCFVANTRSAFVPEACAWKSMADGEHVQFFVGACAPEEVTKSTGVVQFQTAGGGGGRVSNIFFDASPQEIKAATLPSGSVAYSLGIVFIASSMVDKLMQMCVTPPLDACTYLGIDAGAPPLPLSLFLDVFTAMTAETTKEQYMERSARYKYGRKGDPRLTVMRSKLYSTLGSVPLFGVPVRGRTPRNDFPDVRTFLSECFPQTLNSTAACSTAKVNSVLGPRAAVAGGCLVAHSSLHSACRLGKGCMVSDVHLDSSGVLDLGAGLALVCWHLGQQYGRQRVFSLVGTSDRISRASGKTPIGTFLNQPWESFFKRTGIQAEELWVKGVDRQSLYNAKLFPVSYGSDTSAALEQLLWMQPNFSGDTRVLVAQWRRSWRLSLADLVRMVDVQEQFQHRIDLAFKQSLNGLSDALAEDSADGGMDVQAFFKTCAAESRLELLEVLDRIACTTKHLGSRARVFAWIADALGSFSKGRGGLRSGPANNRQWAGALHLLVRNHREGGDLLFTEAVTALSKQRAKWMRDPLLLVRAARHYERASHILIGQAVTSARAFITVPSLREYEAGKDSAAPPHNQWMVAKAAARLDIAGGWSDTPPVAFEEGGKVVNVAVLVNGRRPIGAEGRRIPEPELRFVLHDGSGLQHVVTVKSLEEIRTFKQPQSEGALLKAAVCCVGIIDHTSDMPLPEQLRKVRGPNRRRVPDCCGFELHSWSELPQGSGMGTSSILAAAIINVLWRLVGVNPDNKILHHIVLLLEQMLTTGGGWQDQIGGINPGVKLGSSRKGLPLHVQHQVLAVSDATLASLNRHLLLIYTGKTRLARDLLQNVLRNWYSHDPTIVSNVRALVANAEAAAKACCDGDLAAIGRCVDTYWTQKKIMAPGCEPQKVTDIMALLRPHVFGQSMAGAGGGGFMYAITKQPDSQQRIADMLAADPRMSGVAVFGCSVDAKGMSVSESDKPTYKPPSV